MTVGNAKDAGVAAALAPLAGAEAEITGTHAPQSAVLKVTAVNGTQVTAPAAAAPAATTTAPAAPKL